MFFLLFCLPFFFLFCFTMNAICEQTAGSSRVYHLQRILHSSCFLFPSRCAFRSPRVVLAWAVAFLGAVFVPTGCLDIIVIITHAGWVEKVVISVLFSSHLYREILFSDFHFAPTQCTNLRQPLDVCVYDAATVTGQMSSFLFYILSSLFGSGGL